MTGNKTLVLLGDSLAATVDEVHFLATRAVTVLGKTHFLSVVVLAGNKSHTIGTHATKMEALANVKMMFDTVQKACATFNQPNPFFTPFQNATSMFHCRSRCRSRTITSSLQFAEVK